MRRTIYFDMDGTIVDLYGEEKWLEDLIKGVAKPYRDAKPFVDMRKLGRLLNSLQARGYEVGIISWLSKSGNARYNELVTKTKKAWLGRHLGAVEFDEIIIVEYGTPKESFATENDILFDDEEINRINWKGQAFGVEDILGVLEGL